MRADQLSISVPFMRLRKRPYRGMIDTAFLRITEVDDPGIVIHLADIRDLLAQAEARGAFAPSRKAALGRCLCG
ncbi:hypothetical protein GGD50_005304 [Rhizobium paranaense]|uniref:Uncharacterized protein n=1 Tax=Rhizobium paranaense TaxID=1650438 RepID=A0A7W8XW29_9HYPH|nr:hypothetical protein [Rhizobium paranaense]